MFHGNFLSHAIPTRKIVLREINVRSSVTSGFRDGQGAPGVGGIKEKNESILSSFGEGENEKTWVVAMVAA